MARKFSVKKFDELSSVDLYYILQARLQTFVVDANKPYQDLDELDFDSIHVVVHKDGELIGYNRIVLPNLDNPNESKKIKLKAPIVFDKTLILKDHRGYGIGHQMLVEAIQYCHENYPKRFIKVVAPIAVADFYTLLNFEACNEPTSNGGSGYVELTLNPLKKTKSKMVGINFTQLLSVVLILFGLGCIALLLYLMPS